MVMQPPNACKTCGGTHFVVDIQNSKVDKKGWPLKLAEKPCSTCNPHGLQPKVRY